MKVTHANESGSFWVQSADDHEPYKVDMTANEGNGECLCRDFQCRCFPQWRKSGKIVDYASLERTRCKHLNAVIMFLGNHVVDRLNGKS